MADSRLRGSCHSTQGGNHIRMYTRAFYNFFALRETLGQDVLPTKYWAG